MKFFLNNCLCLQSTLHLERSKRNYFERELLLQCTEDLLLDWRLNNEIDASLVPEQRILIDVGFHAVEAEQYSRLGLFADTSTDMFISHPNLVRTVLEQIWDSNHQDN